VKRGDVYWATLSPRSGSEQQGLRPVMIVSEDGLNSVSSWNTVIVVPLSTSDTQAKRGLSAVSLAKGEGGLPEDCTALCHQITTLDKSKLGLRIGELGKEALARVEVGVCRAIGIDIEFVEE
jgi:mRNA interferase MazF